jgi:hypothetical protein
MESGRLCVSGTWAGDSASRSVDDQNLVMMDVEFYAAEAARALLRTKRRGSVPRAGLEPYLCVRNGVNRLYFVHISWSGLSSVGGFGGLQATLPDLGRRGSKVAPTAADA